MPTSKDKKIHYETAALNDTVKAWETVEVWETIEWESSDTQWLLDTEAKREETATILKEWEAPEAGFFEESWNEELGAIDEDTAGKKYTDEDADWRYKYDKDIREIEEWMSSN